MCPQAEVCVRGSATVAHLLTNRCVMGLPTGVRGDNLSHSEGVGAQGVLRKNPEAASMEGLPGNTRFQPQEKEQPDPEK